MYRISHPFSPSGSREKNSLHCCQVIFNLHSTGEKVDGTHNFEEKGFDQLASNCCDEHH